ncbi:MAG TPA: aminopeptidase P family N-terminal domain-containing protein, partial [Stellaceae bacterium]|nr:aminopeptidase P family N-terminal domain-containing protein [Stellaceae bacterium]
MSGPVRTLSFAGMDSPATDADAELAAVLRREGASYDPAALRELVAGVLAAPPGEPADAWMSLVVPSPSPALRSALSALASAMAAAARPAMPDAARRLALLRAELARRGVHGFLVPRADEHQGEYVPSCAQRLAWLTGFTGSAGLAAVLTETAAIFVDGRYTLQARSEVDPALYGHRHLTEQPAAEWLAEKMKAGEILAYDPKLHTVGEVERLHAAAEKAGGRLAALPDNPVDAVWAGRPPQPLAPVVAH